jgi:tetratricopeptide (TPR) repeat protein
MKLISLKILKICILNLVLTSCSSESLQGNVSYNSNLLISSSLNSCHQKDYSEGKSSLEKVMTAEKTNPFYWNALGICFALSGQYQKAIFYYEIGIEALTLYKNADKKLAEAALTNNIGLIHLFFKRFNDAYSAFKRAETLVPDLYIVQLNISQLLLQFNHDTQSLVILKKLEVLHPGDMDVVYSLALIYSRNGEYEKSLLALAKINNALTSRPDIAGVYAYNFLNTNQLIDAQTMIEKSKSKDQYEEYYKRNKILEKEITAKIKEQSIQTK